VTEEELIQRYIQRDPDKPGVEEARLANYYQHVWALIGHWKATNHDAAEVAAAYDVPEEAIHAALAYYRRHKAAIDTRLAAHMASVDGSDEPGVDATSDHRDRITQNPEVMVGKPVVRGSRVPVERVLQHLADNPDFDDLLAAYPHLTLDDVRACLVYASAAVSRQRKHRRPVATSSPPRG